MHTMPPEHANYLRNVLRLGVEVDADDFPPKLLDYYWGVKSVADKGTTPLTPNDLMWIVVNSGVTNLERTVDALSFLDCIDDIEDGAAVEVKWRFGKWVDGIYKRVEGDEVVVQLLDGTSEDRKVSHDRVRLAGAA